ncbi:MAG: D-glycerate dehydrogenase, partial [Nitrososphaeria archaeon]|nr:D-glycerate dehydrogenase [Nitrososphaeria archaeon]
FNSHGIPCPKEALIQELADTDAVIADAQTPFDGEAMDAAQRLKIIARYGVGYDNVDVGAATARRIYATFTPGVLSDAMAELTIGFMLCLSRRLCKAHEYVKSGAWTRKLYPFPY